VSYDQPDVTRDAIGQALDAGFRHFTLGLPAPYPANVARWAADEIIAKSVLEPGNAVDKLTDDIRMAIVACVLPDYVGV
jgi:hypothetical protein